MTSPNDVPLFPACPKAAADVIAYLRKGGDVERLKKRIAQTRKEISSLFKRMVRLEDDMRREQEREVVILRRIEKKISSRLTGGK